MCTSPQKDKTNPGGASHFHTERIDANVGMHRPGGYIEKCTLLSRGCYHSNLDDCAFHLSAPPPALYAVMLWGRYLVGTTQSHLRLANLKLM